jgi:hypothetical protein
MKRTTLNFDLIYEPDLFMFCSGMVKKIAIRLAKLLDCSYSLISSIKSLWALIYHIYRIPLLLFN